MAIDLDELERLAKAATPSPWRWADDGECLLGPSGDRYGSDQVLGAAPCGYENSHVYASDEDRAFIAAANPTTVLALVDEVRKLRADYADAYHKARECDRAYHEQSKLLLGQQEANKVLRAGLREAVAIATHLRGHVKWDDRYDERIAELRKLAEGT